MKKPYFNQEEREHIRLDTLKGAHLKFGLAVKKYLREVYKESGWVAMKFAERKLVKHINDVLMYKKK